MSDEEEPIGDGYVEPQVYDFLKHISTLSLISIGGILGLIRDEVVDVSRTVTLVALGCIAFSALLALNTNSVIAGASSSGKMPDRTQLKVVRTVAVIGYLFGVGVFVGAFSSAI